MKAQAIANITSSDGYANTKATFRLPGAALTLRDARAHDSSFKS
jgi:hypothetical protein